MKLDLFGRKDKPPQEIAELRLAILEHVKDHITSTRGVFEFPWNRLVVGVLPQDEAQSSALRKLWVEEGRLQADVRNCLKHEDCKYPDNLAVMVHLVDTLPPDAVTARFTISYDTSSFHADAKSSSRGYQLVVIQGIAAPASLQLTKATTYLGRGFEVLNENGALIRSNDVAFAESGDEVNRTVSREHAKITRDTATGEYRLHATRKEAGTQIIRDGKGIKIPFGGRGEPLRAGDEIWLGRARLAFQPLTDADDQDG